MTVSELIEELLQFRQDMPVSIYDYRYDSGINGADSMIFKIYDSEGLVIYPADEDGK
ncbi:MAG: hypothetical protein V4568_18135 [Pseudomonadota bacterium]